MKKITSLLLALVLLVASAAPVAAAQPETALPSYINTSQASVSFVIGEDGSASWTILCIGNSNATAIDAVTRLERKVGVNWVLVDVGTESGYYTYSLPCSRMGRTYEYTFTEYGTYRAVAVFTVYGTSGKETITLWNEHDYGV